MIPKSGSRFPACAKPDQLLVRSFDASAGEGRSEKIMLKEKAKEGHRAPLIVKYKGVSVWRSREGWWKWSLARFILTAVAGRMR